MNLISNTKTVIFDDAPHEIKKLRNALDEMLIQNIYINFGKEPASLDEKKEEDKLTNVRFIFVDILLGSKQEANSSIAIGAVVNAILENISKNNGLFILIVWSKDSAEHTPELIRTLREDENYKFIEIVDIKKSDYLGDDSKSVETLIEDIQKKVLEQKHFNLLREWESDIHKASSKVFDMLLSNNIDVTEDFIKGTIKSNISKKVAPSFEEKKTSLWTSLNKVISDSIEKDISYSEKNKISNDYLDSLDLTLKDRNNLSLLNSKLLFEIPASDKNKIYPGNIFCYNSYHNLMNNFASTFNGCTIDYKEFFENEFFSYSSKNTYLKKQKKEDDTLFQKKVLDCILNEIKPILLEFTPFCDYAQGNVSNARLIQGFLIPFNNMCIKKSESLYVSPFTFQYEGHNYFLVLSLRHIILPSHSLLKHLTLIFRARKELVNDIQHKVAFNMSRVGVSSL